MVHEAPPNIHENSHYQKSIHVPVVFTETGLIEKSWDQLHQQHNSVIIVAILRTLTEHKSAKSANDSNSNHFIPTLNPLALST